MESVEVSGARRSALLFCLLLAILGAWWTAERARKIDDEIDAALAGDQTRMLAVRREALWGSKRYDETGFVRMEPPRKGEWLARIPEPGQTFTEYTHDCRNRLAKGREMIALRPLGPLTPRARAVIEPIRGFCAAFFGTEVRLLEELPLPDSTFQKDRNQYDVTPLLAFLDAERGPDELVHAGILDRDLCWVGQLPNFCFGGASLDRPVGVYSVHRFGLGVVPEPLYRKRAFQLVAHELGHILGMKHCIYYRCLMNGANSLEESDGTPCHLCPVCEKKLRWNLGVERRPRELALAKVFRQEGLVEEAEWAEARADKAGVAANAVSTGK